MELPTPTSPTEWVYYLVAAIILAGGGTLSGIIAAQKNARLGLINEIQEERDARIKEVDKLNARLDLFYADKHASRMYINMLLDHIWQRKPPPPPEPPAGYIP